MNEPNDLPICCGSEMLYSDWGNKNLFGQEVFFCLECGKMVDEETGEVLDAGSE